MKKFIKYPLTLAFLSLLLTACDKVIDIKVDDEIGKLVIEGQINDIDLEQKIKLSKNVSFSAENKYPAVTGALVLVRDDKQREYIFKETNPGTYTAKDFTGSPGTNYSMEVYVEEQKYIAHSKMPERVLLDSIAEEKPELGDKDTRHIKVFYQDPKEVSNYYRFIVFINNKQTKDIIVSNDDFNNGNRVSLTIRPDDDIDIVAGDKIRVEMLAIDKNMYTYWFTLMQQSLGAGITPNNPPNNISPTVLGYFSSHSSSSKTIVVK